MPDKGGDGNFRSVEGIAQKVDAILANIAELRTAAKGNRAVIEAGKNMIVAMKGKGLPDGLFAKMAEAALKMKTETFSSSRRPLPGCSSTGPSRSSRTTSTTE